MSTAKKHLATIALCTTGITATGALPASLASSAQAATAVKVTGKTVPKLTNIRSGPGTTKSVVGRVAAGTSLTGTPSGSWLRIASGRYAGKYIALSALRINTPAPRPTPKPPKPSGPVYRLNSPFACTTNPVMPATSDKTCTKALQYVLNSWMIRTNTPGAQLLTVGGSYGSTTTADVKLFQKANRLKPTGTLDAATWKALATASATTTGRTSAGITGAPGDTHPAFPSTVKLMDGRLLLVFTSSKDHQGKLGQQTLWKTYSADGGYTWSTPQHIKLANGMENFVAGLGIATKGPLAGHPILTTRSVGKAVGDSTSRNHTLVTISADRSGNTWGPLTDVRAADVPTYSASPIVQVNDTNFSQAVYVVIDHKTSARTVALTYDGSRFLIGSVATIAAATTSSSTSPDAVVNTDGGFSEVGMITLRDGRLFAMIRNDTTETNAAMWGAYSSDGGVTWTPPVKLFDGWGAPRLAMGPGGALVVLYRHLSAPSTEGSKNWGKMDAVYRVSTDNGLSWGGEHSLGVHSTYEMGYGTPVFNANGTVTFIFASESSGRNSTIVTAPGVVVKR